MKNFTLLLIILISFFNTNVIQSRNTDFLPATVPQDTTKKLVALVNRAAELVSVKGEDAFSEFKLPESNWRWGDTYVFVIDPDGNMLVNADADMEGKNLINLKDIKGKPIVRGLIAAAMSDPKQPHGWYHYEWPTPGGLLPRWKSSYVELVKAPSGKSYIVGAGMYNDWMEKEFVVDIVEDAVSLIERAGTAAYKKFYDPTSPFLVKDAYVFVVDPTGVEIVNPAFPKLEGRSILDLKDTKGNMLVREMLKAMEPNGNGWVEYMWPKPGESQSTLKSAYVSKAYLGDKWVMVGCGVYLANAATAAAPTQQMTAPELMKLVDEAAIEFEKKGEAAYPEFRVDGSKWYKGTTYFFVWTLDGVRAFHAVNPQSEGVNVSDSKDVLGRPWGQMFMETANTQSGDGWVHYVYPEPGNIFPTWKSSYLKRVTFPSGKDYLIGCGIYNMQMDKAFIEDVVNRAAELVAAKGKGAFEALRDINGPYVFMDTYVFVDDLKGVELVNGAQPSLEGKNIMNLKDIKGKLVTKEYIDSAQKHGSAWVDYYWYKPGNDVVSHKNTYVKKVQFGSETYIVGAGLYED